MKTIRILWHSNAPWCGTGYGQQTALWVPKIASLGHEVVISAFYGMTGTSTNWQGHPVLPPGQHDWGADILPAHVRTVQADLAVTLMDAFVLDPGQLAQTPVIHWLPVDCTPLSRMDRKYLSASGKPVIAMSSAGARTLTAARFPPAAVIPHGTDLAVFRPPDDRDALRKEFGLRDRFVIGINAANKDSAPGRKGLTEQLTAFARFRAEHPDAVLLMHTLSTGPAGVDLEPVLADLGLDDGDSVRFSDPYRYLTGMIGPADLARWYGLLDLFSNCSYGEGFGLGILEAQACGVPVAVTDCSSMPELLGSGWKVSGDLWWHISHQAWWTRPSLTRIQQAYEKAYAVRGTPRAVTMAVRAREFAARYDTDRLLAEHWKPLLEQIEADGLPPRRAA